MVRSGLEGWLIRRVVKECRRTAVKDGRARGNSLRKSYWDQVEGSDVELPIQAIGMMDEWYRP